MPCPQRQADYRRFSPSAPIVIDNGSSHFRIGWAGESDPRVAFRSVVQRPRHKATGETVTIVGDQEPALMRYFDCTRSSCRSTFDSNVVYQFDIMEHILDYGFERLGAESSEVDHPILITECACNPVSSRCRMAELLFETYGVPSIAFGVDAAFSYKYNQQLGICNKDGLAICAGLTTSHVIPFVNGEPAFNACCRTNLGGYNVTDYLKQLLSLKYPYHAANISWEKAEELKIEHCYVALDYASELQSFQKGTKDAEDKTRFWQLPWVPPPKEEPPSEEELARKTALKEKQGQRLREMAAAKRVSRIAEMENELNSVDSLLYELGNAEEDEISYMLAGTRYLSKQEVEAAASRIRQALRKAKGEPIEPEEKLEVSLDEKYPLANVSDEMLTPDQLKEKKKQLFLKTTSEGRLRAKQKMNEERMERDKQLELEEEKRLENPELYLEQLRAKYKDLSEKVEQRKRLKTNGANGSHNTSGGVGRGERLNAAQRERMRLLTTAAFDRGKGEDTFGARDEDWQLYKLMSRDNDDDEEGIDENEEELTRVSSRLQDIDPEFVVKLDSASSTCVSEFIQSRPVRSEDFKVVLGVERFRCPEILFQPGMVGVDQAGLDEMAGVSLRRLRIDEDAKGRISSSILVTGGSCLFSGLVPRLEAGIRKLRPYLSPLKVVTASDPILDAWRGASLYAARPLFRNQTFDRNDYYEKGEDWLRRYNLTYTL